MGEIGLTGGGEEKRAAERWPALRPGGFGFGKEMDG